MSIILHNSSILLLLLLLLLLRRRLPVLLYLTDREQNISWHVNFCDTVYSWIYQSYVQSIVGPVFLLLPLTTDFCLCSATYRDANSQQLINCAGDTTYLSAAKTLKQKSSNFWMTIKLTLCHTHVGLGLRHHHICFNCFYNMQLKGQCTLQIQTGGQVKKVTRSARVFDMLQPACSCKRKARRQINIATIFKRQCQEESSPSIKAHCYALLVVSSLSKLETWSLPVCVSATHKGWPGWVHKGGHNKTNRIKSNFNHQEQRITTKPHLHCFKHNFTTAWHSQKINILKTKEIETVPPLLHVCNGWTHLQGGRVHVGCSICVMDFSL